MCNDKYSEIQDAIFNFYNDRNVRKLQKLYSRKSMIEILGVDRKELPHSDFLAWLFNPNESHGLGEQPLRMFIQLLLSDKTIKTSSAIPLEENFKNQLITSNKAPFLNVEVKREFSFENDKVKGRIDILIRIKIDDETVLRIIIENKTGSGVHGEQVANYHECFTNTNNHLINDPKKTNINLFVYLTPKSNIELAETTLEEAKTGDQRECIKNNYIQTNYQSLVDYIIEPLIENTTNQYTNYILEDYLNSLNQPSIGWLDDDDNCKKVKGSSKSVKKILLRGGHVMALRTDEKEYIKEVWKDNNSLFDYLNEVTEKMKKEGGDASVDLLKQFKDNNDELIMAIIYASITDPSFVDNKTVNDLADSLLEKYSSSERTMTILFDQEFKISDGSQCKFGKETPIYFLKPISDDNLSQAKILSKTKVEWDGKEMSITAATKEILEKYYSDMNTTVNGCLFFGLEPNGKSLYDLAKSL